MYLYADSNSALDRMLRRLRAGSRARPSKMPCGMRGGDAIRSLVGERPFFCWFAGPVGVALGPRSLLLTGSD